MSDQNTPIAPIPRISIQAFCIDENTYALLNQAAQDRRMSRAHFKAQMGGVKAAVAAFQDAPTPNLIVIESFSGREQLAAELDALAELCDEGAKVLVIGAVNDIVLYRDLMSRGVSEYLVHPFEAMDFMRIVSGLYATPTQRLVGRVIAVTGVKGGCGSSTLAHNLGASISRILDQPTIIVDMDLPFGTAGLDFNQDPPQGIADAIFANDRLDANYVERLLSRCSDNLSILAAPAMLDRTYDLNEDALEPLIEFLRGAAPFIVLDLPHGWSGWKRNAILGADELVVVAGPDLASLRNAKNVVDLVRAARPQDMTPRLVLNGVGMPKRPEITAADFAAALDLKPSAIIPHEPKVFGAASNNGQMLADVEGSSKLIPTLAQLARTVTNRTEQRAARRRFMPPIFTKLKSALA